MLLVGSSFTLLHKLITKLHETFDLKKLDIPQYFLGIEVHYQENRTLILHKQSKFEILLAKINMTEAKEVTTPMFNTCKLRKHGDDKLFAIILYISTIGAL